MNEETPTLVAQVIAAIIAIAIVVASAVTGLMDETEFARHKAQFELTVIKTLLPLFALMAVAIVGKAVASRPR